MKLLDAGKVLLGAKLDKVLTGPFFVQIGICNACNYRCVMCWDHPPFINRDDLVSRDEAKFLNYDRPSINYASGNVFMPLEQYRSLIDELSEMGTCQVKICGHGEPLLNKDVLEMIKHTSARGISCHLVTNGSLLTKDSMYAFSDAGLDRLHISLNAASMETYSKIHLNAPKESFKRIVGLLESIDESHRRMDLQASFVITSLNYREIKDFISLAGDCGLSRVVFVLVTTYRQTDSLRLSADQQKDLMLEIKEAAILADKLKVKTNLTDLKKNIDARVDTNNKSKYIYDKIPCYVGWYFSQINADGAVTPCCECIGSIGNINNNLFKEIWYGAEYDEFRRSSRRIPQTRKFPPACRCNDCGFQLNNVLLHRLLHPLSTSSGILSGDVDVKDLLQKIR